MLARLGQIALERGKSRVRIIFGATAKNQPAREFLDAVGAILENRDQEGFLWWEAAPETLIALGRNSSDLSAVSEYGALTATSER